MSFASAERAYLQPPEDWSCERCEDDPDMDHDDCIDAAQDAYDEEMERRAEARREDEILNGPDEGWEP